MHSKTLDLKSKEWKGSSVDRRHAEIHTRTSLYFRFTPGSHAVQVASDLPRRLALLAPYFF